MMIRRSGRLLLCSVALAATGCSSDSMRFSDMYPGGRYAAAPAGVDARAVGSIGGPAYSPSGAPAGALLPGADVAPRGPSGWPVQPTQNPLVYGSAPTYQPPVLDRTATGSIGAAPAAPRRSLGVGPVRGAVARTALPPVTSPAVAASSARAPVVAAAAEPSSVLAKARAALPSMPRLTRRPADPVRDATPLATRVAAAKVAAGWGGEGGRVTVGEGQTLYNLSKRFGVPVAAIMAANGITDPTTVRLGQTLVIPRYTYGDQAAVSAPDADPNVRASTAGRGMIGEVEQNRVPLPAGRSRQATQQTQPAPRQVAAVATVPANPVVAAAEPSRPASTGGTVTVGSGDTLYAISRRTGVSVDALRTANALQSDSIRVGQVLRLPGAAAPVQVASAPAPTRAAAQPAVARRVAVPTAASVAAAPKSLPRTNPPELDTIQTASITSKPAPAAQSSGALRRPADGRVIRRFGGAQKGIDISVPAGSPVRAAENGTVIYAGSGLKEFGKTVLIQHADGLVTVYGHADTLKVAKGQKVTRGDVIASSGMTGEAESPRVHFQVRKGSTPVDPESFL